MGAQTMKVEPFELEAVVDIEVGEYVESSNGIAAMSETLGSFEAYLVQVPWAILVAEDTRGELVNELAEVCRQMTIARRRLVRINHALVALALQKFPAAVCKVEGPGGAG
jgi:septation ring formation regulator EzrA